MTSFEETTYFNRDRFAQPTGYERRDEDPTHVHSFHQFVPENGTQNVPLEDSILAHDGYTGLNGLEMHHLSPGTERSRFYERNETSATTLENEQGFPVLKGNQPWIARTTRYISMSFGHRDMHKIRTYSWTWEFIALGLSAISMVAMISLLAWADNRPLLEWKFFLSFNAVISILGTLCKAPFAFVVGSCLSQAKWNWFRKRLGTLETYGKIDAASRGPLGSILLAYHVHVRHWIVVGALVAVALTIFEPFLQAVVFYSGQTENSGIILAATRIDAGTYVPSEAGSYLVTFLPSGQRLSFEGTYLSKPDTGLASAFLNGLDTHYSAYQLTPPWNCPSGSCTWEPFTSAAICSSCHNISDHLQRTTFNTLDRNLSTALWKWNRNLSNFSLPLISIINYDDSSGPDDGYKTFMAAASTSNPGESISFQHINTLLAAYQIIKPSKTFENNLTRWDETEISATECGFYLCAQAYNSVVINGTLTEKVLGSWSQRTPQSYAILPGGPATDDPDILAEYDDWSNHSLISPYPGEDFSRSDLVLEISEQELGDAGIAVNATRAFTFSQNMTGSTSYFLGLQIMDNAESNSGNISWPLKIWPQTDLTLNEKFRNPLSVILAQALHDSDDLGTMFEQLAKGMTNWARHYAGVQYFSPRKDLVIQIRWAYLSLPAVCLVAGYIFILLSMVETKRSGLKPWKDDFVFSLAHSLDSESEDLLRASEKTHCDTKDLTKNMTVRFENTAGFWQLRGQTKPT